MAPTADAPLCPVWAAKAHTPVLPEATLVGAVSAQLRSEGRCQLRPLNVDSRRRSSGSYAQKPDIPDDERMGQIRRDPINGLPMPAAKNILPPLAIDLRASKLTFRSFALAKAVDGGSLTLGLTLILRGSARSVP